MSAKSYDLFGVGDVAAIRKVSSCSSSSDSYDLTLVSFIKA